MSARALRLALAATLITAPLVAQRPPAAQSKAPPAAPAHPAQTQKAPPPAPPPAAAHPAQMQKAPPQNPAARPAPAPAPAPAHAAPPAAPAAGHAASPTAPAGAHPAPPAAPGAAPRPGQRPAGHDSVVDSTTVPITYMREVYNYQGAPRDPFASLNSAAAATTFADLRLVSVLYDARGGRSVAVVRDRSHPTPLRLRRGDTVGRLRVIQIRPYEVVFQVEEFGFERQEVLTLQRPEVNR